MHHPYSFILPESLIAKKPAEPRDSARLLVYSLADGSIKDSYFYNLPSFLDPRTTLAVNNSRVETCRWLFDDGKTEIFILEKTDMRHIRAMVRPGRKFKNGSIVVLTEWLHAKVLDCDASGVRTLELSMPHDDPRLKQYEHIPLPPYIPQDDSLADDYQTVYADPLGSLAAPTAGLHFTPALMQKIRKEHPVAKVTLHVGLGTFAKLTEQNFKQNKLHEESFYVAGNEATILQNAPHITAVGTTTIRTLETIRRDNKAFHALSGSTDIFIQPGHKFKAVDSVITNFHLPGTSLLLLIAAFIADKRNLNETSAEAELQRIYAHAIGQSYRFYSFGDAMLLV